jgi:hypothetical protein
MRVARLSCVCWWLQGSDVSADASSGRIVDVVNQPQDRQQCSPDRLGLDTSRSWKRPETLTFPRRGQLLWRGELTRHGGC